MQEEHLQATSVALSIADHRDDIVQDLPPPENKRFYPALDGLRALAILMVFFEHYGGFHYPALNWGWAGVDVFFVLSGFLITGILYDTRNTSHRFRNFYARRTLRIFPLYYAVLFFGVALTPIFHWLWNPAWILWFSYLGNYARFLYLHSPLFPIGAIEHLVAQRHRFALPALLLGHFWSLGVEEQFYLIWPLVVFRIGNRVRLRNLCGILCVLALLARIVCVLTVPVPYLQAELLYRLTPLRVDALLFGAFAALCVRGPEGKHLLQFARPVFWGICFCLAAWQLLYRALSGTGHVYHPETASPVLSTIGFTLIDLVAAVLIVAILEPKGTLFHLFNYKWARRLGQISYGFYVFHDMFRYVYEHIAVFLLRGFGHYGIGTGVIGLVSTTAISYLSFRYFETPFLRLKDRFTA